MAFDIDVEAKEIAAEDEGVVVNIVDAKGEPAIQADGSPVTWTVCGLNSQQYRKAEAWQRKQFRAIRGREQTQAEYEAMQAEFIARCSLSNTGFVASGQALPFSTENATLILVRLPHVRRQIEAAIADHEGFTKRPSTN